MIPKWQRKDPEGDWFKGHAVAYSAKPVYKTHGSPLRILLYSAGIQGTIHAHLGQMAGVAVEGLCML